MGISMGGQGTLAAGVFVIRVSFPSPPALRPAIDYHELYGRGLSIDAMYDSKGAMPPGHRAVARAAA